MNNPLVSVIIPTYKSRGGLIKSVDSALHQSYSNIEIIVVDDNNPDMDERRSTEFLMERYIGNAKVKYIKHDVNKNGAAARNTGIHASKGEYIAFLDDDDEWLPSKIEKQINFMLNNNEFDAVYTYTVTNGKQPYTKPYKGNVIIPLFMGRSRMYTSTLLMTRSSVETINGFDESFRRHQDYELLIKFFSCGFKIGCLEEVLVRYMPLGGNSPKGKDFRLLKDQFLSTFEATLDDLEKTNKGVKNKILAANYALVFYADIASHKFTEAYRVLHSSISYSPKTFIGQCLFLLRSKFSKKKNDV